jgi:LPXTG-site transpeptidase (sortase) family protein
MKSTQLRLLRDINIFLILFFFTSFFTFLILNGGAFWRDIRYALYLNSPFASADLKQGDILAVANADGTLPGGATGSTSTGSNTTSSTDANGTVHPSYNPGSTPFTLTIPKISVVTPIAIPEAATKAKILASLELGVGLYPGSSNPGDVGRAVMLGHSSRASWYRGNYATIFTLLGKLEIGDQAYITANNKKYVYEVFKTNTLSKADTDALLATSTSGSEIDLVTCYPIGGASKRTVIQAKLVRTEAI